MANLARAQVETALRARKLDRTLTTVLPWLERTDPATLLPTGSALLDSYLDGGLPRGHLSEIAGPRSSGRTTVMLQVLAAATRRGELAALVDTFDRFDMASASAAGIDLCRLLWIRGDAISYVGRGASAGDRCTQALERAIKALNLVLQAGGFGVVVFDAADVTAAELRQLPYTTWIRLQRTIEKTETACLMVVSEPTARSAGGLTLVLAGRSGWVGHSERSRRLSSFSIHARAISPRRRVDGEVKLEASLKSDIAISTPHPSTHTTN